MSSSIQSSLTRRHLLGAGAGISTALALGGCGFGDTSGTKAQTRKTVKAAVDGDLIYFNWADYMDPSVFKGFKAEYGVNIIKSNYDSMESMQAKLSAGNRYDIILPSAQWVKKLRAANKLLEIDHSQVPNSKLVFDYYPSFAQPWYDPDSGHSIPFSMYKTGIAWRKDKLGDKLTDSWNDLWNTKAKGQTYALDDRDEVLGMLALLLGYPIDTADPKQLKEIVKKAATLRPNLRAFSSDDYLNLLRGDAWLQQTWSGDVYYVLTTAKDASLFAFESPKEGTPINSDAWAIPANAQHPGTALLFIDYLLRPENVKKNMKYIGYPMPVHGTEATYEKMIAEFPQCRVSLADLDKHLYFNDATVAVTQARDAAWTEIKAG